MTSPKLWCDNIGATYLSSNPIFHVRTKHIEIHFHYVRDQVLAKKLQDSFLSTTNQLADLLTKPLSSVRFHLLRANLHVQDLPIRLRGRIGDKTESDSNDTVAAKGTIVSSRNRKDCN